MNHKLDLLTELSELDKTARIDITNCRILGHNDIHGTPTTLLECDGRYFLAADNSCREVIKDEIFSNYMREEFVYTPDDLHLYHFSYDNQQHRIYPVDVYNLELEQIVKGMSCRHNGLNVTYNNDTSLIFATNDMTKTVKVKPDDEYVFSIQKTQILAANGAKGLYIFLDNIAERDNFSQFGGTYFDKFKNELPNIKAMSKKAILERE